MGIDSFFSSRDTINWMGDYPSSPKHKEPPQPEVKPDPEPVKKKLGRPRNKVITNPFEKKRQQKIAKMTCMLNVSDEFDEKLLRKYANDVIMN